MTSRVRRVLTAAVCTVLGVGALSVGSAQATGGTTWTLQTARSDYWAGVAYGAGTYVAVSVGNVMTSPDGVTWTNQSVTGGWVGVMFDGTQFVAVGNSGSAHAMTSPDGFTWTQQTSLNTGGYTAVAKSDDTYVAVAQEWVGYSNDAAAWTEYNNNPGIANQWRSVTFGDDTFVAVNYNTGGTAPVMTSNDGVTWTLQSAGIPVEQWNGVTYGAGLFVAVGGTGTDRVMTSPDGVNWTTRTTPGSDYWRAVTYAGGQFVAVGHTGAVMTSPDAISWTAQTSGTTGVWRAITGGPQYVAVGQTLHQPVMTSDMVQPPTFSAIAPPTGSPAGGEALTIDGTGFVAGVSVDIGGSACTGVTVVSATQLTCTSPAGTLGAANVVVTNADTQSVTSAGAFTYAVPTPSTPPVPVVATAPQEVVGAAGDRSVEVSWSAPASSGSFAISNYQVSSVPAGGSCLTSSMSCTVSGLSNGVGYVFRVRALTGAGWGPWSATSADITPGPPPPVVPSITITGTRGEAGGKPGIVVTGSAMEMAMGTVLRPWLRFPGQTTFSEGADSILVDIDGGFTWSRHTGKNVTVYVATLDGSVKSNRVTIAR